MIFKNRPFAWKLSFYILSATVLLGLLLISLNYNISRYLLFESVSESAANKAGKNVYKIEAVLQAVQKIPLNLAAVIEHSELDESKILNLMETVVANNDDIYGSAIAFEPYKFKRNRKSYAPYIYKNGDKIVTTDLESESYQYIYQDWYQIPRLLDKPVWSEPYYDEGGGNILMSTYSVPFYKFIDGSREFCGIVTIDIALPWLQQIISDIKILETGYAFLISKHGTIITHPNEDWMMNQTIFSLAEEYNNNDLRVLGRMMIDGMSGFTSYPSIKSDESNMIYYASLPSNGWCLAMIFPQNELYSHLRVLSLMLLLLGIGGLVVLFVLIKYISKKATEPLHQFAETVKHIGGGDLDFKLPEYQANDEIGMLNRSFGTMRDELKQYIDDLQNTTVAKEKIESELRVAHQIQMGMIPKLFPPFPDRPDIAVHAVLEPAKQVGGDLYDFFFIDGNKFLFGIGDVAGKGVPASLFMAVTRTLFRSKAEPKMTASELVTLINNTLCEDNESQLFVTYFLGILNVDTGELDFSNAGHNYPYILRKDGNVEQISETHGMALGLFGEIPYKSNRLKLNRGDRIILYTDGVNEAMNPDFEEFTNERLEAIFPSLIKKEPKECTAEIMRVLKEFTLGADQSDDITLMAIKFK